MQTQSTEAERIQEQITANRRRIARYRRESHRIEGRELDVSEIPLSLIPGRWWFKPQAD